MWLRKLFWSSLFPPTPSSVADLHSPIGCNRCVLWNNSVCTPCILTGRPCRYRLPCTSVENQQLSRSIDCTGIRTCGSKRTFFTKRYRQPRVGSRYTRCTTPLGPSTTRSCFYVLILVNLRRRLFTQILDWLIEATILIIPRMTTEARFPREAGPSGVEGLMGIYT